MNLKNLAIFREVMRTGSVSQAARNLNRTQPALSAGLKALEDELGISLFERRNRRLVPVPEAHYLMSEATDILSRLQTAEQNMRSIRDFEKGVLRIVAMPGPSAFLLPKVISEFTGEREDIRVTLTTRSSPQVHKMVATQSFDLGIADISGTDHEDDLLNGGTMKGNCLCAVHRDDDLSKSEVITTSDLSSKPMGVLQPEHFTYQKTVEAFNATNTELNIRFDAQYFLPLLNFIEAGQACAIVDPLSAESYRMYTRDNDLIRFIPFMPKIPLTYACLTPAYRPMSAIAKAFMSMWNDEVQRIISYFECR
ncbi:LysR family transcriptional regulator [Kiloniella majae]|uniref:LysR family transcriptional regulator n=1 Tax=Kiloniella majae TaxID=1938558 RepID=UPI000A277217|nr:LysR family transcriptional regulator [Kiloniella majae]